MESPETLEKAVTWTRFPPDGVRGFGLVPLHVDNEKATIPEIIEHVNANILVAFQIETQRGVDARNELVSVPGVDAVFIGPADLSISLGVGGDFLHAKMVDAIDKIHESCLKHKVASGSHSRGIQQAKFLIDRGLRFVGCSNDTSMLFDRASEIVRGLSLIVAVGMMRIYASAPRLSSRNAPAKANTQRQREIRTRGTRWAPFRIGAAVEQYAGTVDVSMQQSYSHAGPDWDSMARKSESVNSSKRLKNNLADDDPAHQDRVVDEFRSLILGRCRIILFHVRLRSDTQSRQGAKDLG